MKKCMLLGLGIAMAALLVSGPVAASDEEDATVIVDWDDAVLYAELMDTYVNDDGIVIDTYYDEGQNVLWSQPASEPVEAAAEAFAVGPEYAATLLITQWVVPTSFWLCDHNKTGDDDPDCTSGTNYKWSSSGIYLYQVVNQTAFYYLNYTPCVMSSIDRIRAGGNSSSTNYCNADYRGYYWGSSDWGLADDYSCLNFFGYYMYLLDDSSHINNRTYTAYSAGRVAKFKYKSGGVIYASEIWFSGCMQ